MSRYTNSKLVYVWFSLFVAAWFASSALQAEEEISFARDIQPILAGKCFLCHGADTQESGLRLDSFKAATGEADSGEKAIVPGSPDESELIRRITSDDPDERMPAEAEPLSPTEVDKLRAWIAAGAKYEKHWAFCPLQEVSPPDVKNESWVANPIDRFVLAKLESEGVTPSVEADRYTLIKRLYYDLVGLPPEIEQVDAFVADRSPDAYEKLVDRLLASPHFGERWGRHWLDMARFADTDGYEKDNTRPDAWRYRDWVIRAFNNDMPFDRFTIEQLAGDLMDGSNPMTHLATAFNRQTLTNKEGGVDQEEFRVAAVLDRTETLGTVWLALTVGCAKCHSHKYDPFSQTEYYQLSAFFNNADETTTNVVKSAEEWSEYQRVIVETNRRIRKLEPELARRKEELSASQTEWEADLRRRIDEESADAVPYHPVLIKEISSSNENDEIFERQKDGSYLVSGPPTMQATYTIEGEIEQSDITGFRLEVLPDESLPLKGPGRSDHGNFVLSEFRAYATTNQEIKEEDNLSIESAEADFSQRGYQVSQAVDSDTKTGWAIRPRSGVEHWATFWLADPLSLSGTVRLRIVMDQQYGKQHNIGRFRITALTGRPDAHRVPKSIRDIVKTAPEKRPREQQEELLTFRLQQDVTASQLLSELDDLRDRLSDMPVMEVRVISQRVGEPRETHLLHRGDFLQPKDQVVPGTPSLLPPLELRTVGAEADRLDLAKWLFDDRNPLVPRVAVNHIWSHLFGYGLVHTMNNFGVRGDLPTHPELLDWLATEYRRCGWSRKAMIKLIVTSATYRQASRQRPELVDRDPDNRWLARQNRFRVEAEIVRDTALAASGLLSPKIGGPSVFPPIPAGVTDLSYQSSFKWKTSEGEDRYRRGLYTFFKRTAPHPNLTSFDCPDANLATVERNRSNTPIGALITLNNEVFVEAAQALASRVLCASCDDDRERLTYAFRLCVARPPDDEEIETLTGLLEQNRRYYAANAEAATQLVGEHTVRDTKNEEMASWIATVRVVLNLDEFITRE